MPKTDMDLVALEALVEGLREEGVRHLTRYIPESVSFWAWEIDLSFRLGYIGVVVFISFHDPDRITLSVYEAPKEVERKRMNILAPNAWADAVYILPSMFAELWAQARERAGQ